MPLHGNEKIGRNDACPCGSGKKYKRCCLEQQLVTYSLWAQQRDESDALTRAMIRYVRNNHEDLALDAWKEFHLEEVTRQYQGIGEFFTC